MPAEHRVYQETSAVMAGFDRQFMALPHVPFPLNKHMFVDFFEENQAMLEANLKHAFRDITQFWSVSLMYHLGLKHARVVLDHRFYGVTLHAKHHNVRKIQKALARARRDPRAAFACIQSLDEGTPSVRAEILAWLDEQIPTDLKREGD